MAGQHAIAIRSDPLGSEPTGDPALDETSLQPPLTPELQARIPARLLRLYVPGETLLEALPRLREVYCGSIAYEMCSPLLHGADMATLDRYARQFIAYMAAQ